MIEISDLSKAYDAKVLFKDYHLEIPDGSFLIISGDSGCGKTTLLNMIGGIEPPDKGQIIVNGVDITKEKNKRRYYRDMVGFLFQNFALLEQKTVRDNLDIQRVALARLMVKKCNLILADEPTGSLDENNSNIVMNILHELNDMGKTVIVVIHSKKIVDEEKFVVKLA